MNLDCTCDCRDQNCKAYYAQSQLSNYNGGKSHYSNYRNYAGEGDPLREINRCISHDSYCLPRAHCSYSRSKSLSNEFYILKANQNIDPCRSLSTRIYFCDLHDEEWNSSHLLRSCNERGIGNKSIGDGLRSKNSREMTFEERNIKSRELRTSYVKELAALKERLHVLRNGVLVDGKRVRQRSESEPGCFNSGIRHHKRVRDRSPPLKSLNRRACCDSGPSISFRRETKSVPPVISCRNTKNLPILPLCRDEKAENSVDEVSEVDGSISSEDGTLGDELIEDDDYSLASSNTSGSNDSNTPSHVGRSLRSICLNETQGEPTATSSTPDVPLPLTNDISLFRPSLFFNVPPYIQFCMHDVKGPGYPADISKHLKWKLSTITPIVIRRTLVNSGFRLIRKSNDWTGQWGKHMNSFLFKTLKDFQKLNHFPGTFQIGRKDRLWKNLNRLMHKFGKKEFGFIPTTYILPQDNKSLRIAWEKMGGKGQWIVKPPAAARGTGIRVVHRWSDIPKNKPLIVQKYISQPYLINGSKFDLRLYVLMTSVHPLRIYLYDDGLVRFASVKYSENMESLGDRFMHLTNYSINKLSNQYRANEDASSCHGHKWTLKTLWTYLEKQGVNVKSLQKNMTDLVIKTIISGESHIQALSKNNLPSRYCSYELFGIDVLLDAALRPWLLEVNISPSLHSSSPLDLAVKGPLVRELLNLAGFQVPAKLSEEQEAHYLSVTGLSEKCSTLCYDKRLYTTTLSREERIKHATNNLLSRNDYLPSILDNLTADDVRHLIQFEDELTQLKRFEKVFPTPNTHSYHQFFDSPRYYNMIFDAWEYKYHMNRSEGIQLLDTLCRENLHLEVPFPGSKAKYSVNRSDLNASKEATAENDESEGNSSRDSSRPSSRCGKRRRTGVLARTHLRTALAARQHHLHLRQPPMSESSDQIHTTSQPWRHLLQQSCKMDAAPSSTIRHLPPIDLSTSS